MPKNYAHASESNSVQICAAHGCTICHGTLQTLYPLHFGRVIQGVRDAGMKEIDVPGHWRGPRRSLGA